MAEFQNGSIIVALPLNVASSRCKMELKMRDLRRRGNTVQGWERGLFPGVKKGTSDWKSAE